jgi:putative Holliday junction resolvase
MAIITIHELKPLKTGKNRIMGIDLGDKTIGLCLSDLTWSIATPMETLKRTNLDKDLLQLATYIQQYHVIGLVIGLPINMNGTEGPQAQKVRQFASKLLENIEIPIILWDERLSTTAVTRTLLEADISRRRRSQVVDKMAASFILQGALDGLKL